MSDVTWILNAIEEGDVRASDALLPLVYEELRMLAAKKLSQEAPRQTLQATALVHEAYIRLVGVENPNWENRGHFFMAAAGTYKPTSDYGLGITDRGKHFRMKNRVAIYGGFPATGDPGWLDRDPNTCETILSGDIGTLNDPNDNCYHVFYHPEGTNLDPNALLDGFTIAGGHAYGASWRDPNSHGGGMYNYHSSPIIINCTFSGNVAGTGRQRTR